MLQRASNDGPGMGREHIPGAYGSERTALRVGSASLGRSIGCLTTERLSVRRAVATTVARHGLRLGVLWSDRSTTCGERENEHQGERTEHVT